MRALVTGANGFVGSALCRTLLSRGWTVTAAVRHIAKAPPGTDAVEVGDFDGTTDWTSALRGVNVVFHLASRVHMMRENVRDPERAYGATNVAATATLAAASRRAGVANFVFASTAKIHGDLSPGRAFTERDAPRPPDAYSRSKVEAEEAIRSTGGLTATIVRPPLVYGPGVRANFLSLIRLVDRGIPLPLASVHNSRSMIYVENLVDALIVSAAGRGGTFLVTDGEDISTPQLIRTIARHLGRSPKLFRFPPALLALGGARAERLTQSLVFDAAHFRQMFDWRPPFTPGEGIEATVRWYRANVKPG